MLQSVISPSGMKHITLLETSRMRISEVTANYEFLLLDLTSTLILLDFNVAYKDTLAKLPSSACRAKTSSADPGH